MAVSAVRFILFIAGIINVEVAALNAAAKVHDAARVHTAVKTNAAAKVHAGENPVRKVITLLERIRSTLIAEAKAAKVTYDKAMCKCETAGVQFQGEIKYLKTEIPQVVSQIQENVAKTETLTQDIKEEKATYDDDVERVEEQTSAIEKKRVQWTEEDFRMKSQIEALVQIIYAIEHGGKTMHGTEFLQTSAAATLEQMAINADMNPSDREMLTNFLSQAAPTSFFQVADRQSSNASAMISSQSFVQAARPGAVAIGTPLCGRYGCCPAPDVDLPKIDAKGVNCQVNQACFFIPCGERPCAKTGKPPTQINRLCCQCPPEKNKLSPGSQELVGMLKNMQQKIQDDLEESIGEEQEETYTYTVQTNTIIQEENVLEDQIQTHTEQKGETVVQTAQQKVQSTDLKQDLSEAEVAFIEFTKECRAKKEEYEENKKASHAELVAIAQTIEILEKDEALDLFKKTLPSPGEESLLQLDQSVNNVRLKALRALQAAHHRKLHLSDQRLGLIEIAMQGGKAGFADVVQMIDNLIESMNMDQKTDDEKKEWCNGKLKEISEALEKHKETISGLEEAVNKQAALKEKAEADIKKLTGEIEGLEQDKVDNRKLRDDQKEETRVKLADNAAAHSLLVKAMDRMNQFYNPVEVPPVDPESPVFVQVHSNEEETKDARGREAIGMLNALINDLSHQSKELTLKETEAEALFEASMKSIQKLIESKQKTLEGAVSAKADAEDALGEASEKLSTAQGDKTDDEALAVSYHKDCDPKLEAYEERKAARKVEIEGLENAKGELSVLLTNFIQTGQSPRRLRGLRIAP